MLLFQGLHEIEISRNRSGTSIGLGGDFAVSLDGARSQYLPSNASARDMKLALETLDTVGTVDVERYDGDEEVRDSLEFYQEVSYYRVTYGAGSSIASAVGGWDHNFSTSLNIIVTMAHLPSSLFALCITVQPTLLL